MRVYSNAVRFSALGIVVLLVVPTLLLVASAFWAFRISGELVAVERSWLLLDSYRHALSISNLVLRSLWLSAPALDAELHDAVQTLEALPQWTL